MERFERNGIVGNNFIKIQEHDDSAVIEALCSTLMGYITNLPKWGFMDYSLCIIDDFLCVYTKAIDGLCGMGGVILGGFKSMNLRKLVGDDLDDYYFESEYLESTEVNAGNKYNAVVKSIGIYTGIPIKDIKGYFLYLTLLDCLFLNPDRTWSNVLIRYDGSKYYLSPYFDFGNSLNLIDGMPAYPHLFSDDWNTELNTCLQGTNIKLKIQYDKFLSDFSSLEDKDLYDSKDLVQKKLDYLKYRLLVTKGKLWVPV